MHVDVDFYALDPLACFELCVGAERLALASIHRDVSPMILKRDLKLIPQSREGEERKGEGRKVVMVAVERT